MVRRRVYDSTTGKFRKRHGLKQQRNDTIPAPGPNPLDLSLIRCKCGKIGFDTREDAELCLDLDRVHTLYECRDGIWHATRDLRPR